MEWFDLYGSNNEPDEKQIEEFINNPLWNELNKFIKDSYDVSPQKSYSVCSMQAGWNIKYKKSGKSLCTLYPMEGYFIALVVTSSKQADETEALIPSCTKYVHDLYNNTSYYNGGKWLMIEVRDKEILEDVKSLVNVRLKPKK